MSTLFTRSERCTSFLLRARLEGMAGGANGEGPSGREGVEGRTRPRLKWFEKFYLRGRNKIGGGVTRETPSSRAQPNSAPPPLLRPAPPATPPCEPPPSPLSKMVRLPPAFTPCPATGPPAPQRCLRPCPAPSHPAPRVILPQRFSSVSLVAALLAAGVSRVSAECPNACSGHGDCQNQDQCACYGALRSGHKPSRFARARARAPLRARLRPLPPPAAATARARPSSHPLPAAPALPPLVPPPQMVLSAATAPCACAPWATPSWTPPRAT